MEFCTNKSWPCLRDKVRAFEKEKNLTFSKSNPFSIFAIYSDGKLYSAIFARNGINYPRALRQTLHRKTKRKFNTRLREHQKAVEQEHPKKSALAEHSLQSGHTISWESSIILGTSPGWRTRRLLEAWEINTCKSPLNRDDGMYLPQEYRALALLDKNWFYSIFCFLLASTRF